MRPALGSENNTEENNSETTEESTEENDGNEIAAEVSQVNTSREERREPTTSTQNTQRRTETEEDIGRQQTEMKTKAQKDLEKLVENLQNMVKTLINMMGMLNHTTEQTDIIQDFNHKYGPSYLISANPLTQQATVLDGVEMQAITNKGASYTAKIPEPIENQEKRNQPARAAKTDISQNKSSGKSKTNNKTHD